MKRVQLFLLLCSCLALNACDNGDQVLAEFSGGQVIRDELRLAFTLNYGPAAESKATTEEQIQRLRELSLLRIQAIEAEKEGVPNSTGFKAREGVLEDQARLLTYQYIVRRDSSERPFQMMLLQGLTLSKTPPGAQPGETVSRTAEAEELMARLNSGELSASEIEALIHQHSDNARYRWFGGYIDPICTSCATAPALAVFTDPVADMDSDHFVLVDQPAAVWLIRKLDEEEVDADDLRDVFTTYYRRTQRIARAYIDQADSVPMNARDILLSQEQMEELAGQQADRTIEFETQNALAARMPPIQRARGFEMFPAGNAARNGSIPALTSETPLFRIDDEIYTYGTLEARLPAPELSAQDRLELLHSTIIPCMLLENEPDFQQANDDDAYAFFYELRKSQLLGSLLLRDRLPPAVVSEAQAREWYDLQRERQFQGQPYAAVRDAIRSHLEQIEATRGLEALLTQLAQEYELKINRDLLEPNSL